MDKIKDKKAMDYKSTLNLPKTSFPMKADLPHREPEILARWEGSRLYQKIQERARSKPVFILHDGPPYANGSIHMGHALNKILKDIILRYKTMRGMRTPFVPGWDCHGLPVELQLLKELNVTKHEVDRVEFREKARAFASRFVHVQREEFKRLGILGDWEHPYLTMSYEYQASIAECFWRLYRAGYIYKGLKPIHWCASCETALAEAEVEYETKSSPSIYVKFPLTADSCRKLGLPEDAAVLIWTTTPWTLPANVAVALRPDTRYALVEAAGHRLILADALLESVAAALHWEGPKTLKTFRAEELESLECDHPFMNRKSLVILGEHVLMDQGTGCVHTAPGHGQEDYEIGLHYRLNILSPVNARGEFTEEVGPFKGQFVFKANQPICDLLKGKRLLLDQGKIEHSYPHCWRCKGPIIFRATPQWFLGVDRSDLREKALRQIEKVLWIPAAGQNRISSMVAARPDWCLSRQRLWGVPIPIFYCAQCETEFLDEETALKVIEEIRKNGASTWFKRESSDWISPDVKCRSCGATRFLREEDIMDVWFDSGVSHQAVLAKREGLSFPADLYLEGSDQHRGWFQTSLLASVGLVGQAPFRSVLTHGFVVDGEGKKMSKSAGNVIAPQDVMKKYGADILRLWVASSDFSQDVRISEDILAQVADTYRKIRNTFRYLLGNLFDYDAARHALEPDALFPIDHWALYRLGQVHARVTEGYERFEFCKIYHWMDEFCTVDLSSFYFDILKDRLYTFPSSSRERRAAQSVLYEILRVLVCLLAPILSFTTEEVWELLHPGGGGGAEASVHMAEWPAMGAEVEPRLSEAAAPLTTARGATPHQGPTGPAPSPPRSLGPFGAWVADAPFETKWELVKGIRSEVLKVLEEFRKAKVIGSALEAKVELFTHRPDVRAALEGLGADLRTIFIVSSATLTYQDEPWPAAHRRASGIQGLGIVVDRAEGRKCQRCWNYSCRVGEDRAHPELCERCVKTVQETVQAF